MAANSNTKVVSFLELALTLLSQGIDLLNIGVDSIPLIEKMLSYFKGFDAAKHWTPEEMQAAVDAFRSQQSELIKPFVEALENVEIPAPAGDHPVAEEVNNEEVTGNPEEENEEDQEGGESSAELRKSRRLSK